MILRVISCIQSAIGKEMIQKLVSYFWGKKMYLNHRHPRSRDWTIASD